MYSEGYAGILLQFVGQSSFDFVVFLSHKHKQTNLFLWIIIRNNTSILPRARGGDDDDDDHDHDHDHDDENEKEDVEET